MAAVRCCQVAHKQLQSDISTAHCADVHTSASKQNPPIQWEAVNCSAVPQQFPGAKCLNRRAVLYHTCATALSASCLHSASFRCDAAVQRPTRSSLNGRGDLQLNELVLVYLPVDELAQAAPADQPEHMRTARTSQAVVQEAYDRYAGTYDQLDGGQAASALGIPDLRRELLGLAHGRVLEVAVGTGLNLLLYDVARVDSLVGIDISEGMLSQRGDAEALPFGAGEFDCVVDTFSLCVFPRPLRALAEMARVTRPGGRVLLLEHSRSANALLGLYQDATARAVAALGKGCVWNQNIPELLRAAGLRVVRSKTSLAGLITLVEAIPAA